MAVVVVFHCRVDVTVVLDHVAVRLGGLVKRASLVSVVTMLRNEVLLEGVDVKLRGMSPVVLVLEDAVLMLQSRSVEDTGKELALAT
jgi:hypothetical protein